MEKEGNQKGARRNAELEVNTSRGKKGSGRGGDPEKERGRGRDRTACTKETDDADKPCTIGAQTSTRKMGKGETDTEGAREARIGIERGGGDRHPGTATEPEWGDKERRSATKGDTESDLDGST